MWICAAKVEKDRAKKTKRYGWPLEHRCPRVSLRASMRDLEECDNLLTIKR